MILILLNWIYATVIFFLFGAWCISFVRKAFRIQQGIPLHFSMVCITGMAITTAVTTILSLLIPVGWMANVIILLMAAIFAFRNRESIRADWAFYRKEARNVRWWYKVIFFGYLFVFLAISAWPTSHFDEGLYYTPSIKWLQEYGTVVGLANLNIRIGFNSSWFVLQSLFGFHFLGIKSLNALNGLLYMLVFIYWLQGLIALNNGERKFHTFLQSLFFLPVLGVFFTANSEVLLYNENLFSSSSTDVPACLIMWTAFLLFIKKEDNQGKSTLNKVLTMIIASYLVTIKLSTFPIILLVIFCWWQLVRQNPLKKTAFITIGCSLIVIPWLVRNVLLTGYLLFPFSSLDFFEVDWKIPLERVRGFAEEIRIYAIDPEILKVSRQVIDTDWFQFWLGRQPFINLVVFVLMILIFVYCLVYGVIGIYRKGVTFVKENSHLIGYFITTIAGITFWALKAPDLRFGYGFCLFFCMFGLAGWVYSLRRKVAHTVGILLLWTGPLLFLFHYDYVWTKWVNKPLKKLVIVRDYRFPEQTDTLSLSPGIHLYLSKEGACWDCPLPCTISSDYEFGIHLRGKTLKEGFTGGNTVSPTNPD